MTYGVRRLDVLQHAIDGALWRVALAVVAPSSGSGGGGGWRAVGQTTAQGLVAVGVRTLLVVGVKVRVRKVQNLEHRRSSLWNCIKISSIFFLICVLFLPWVALEGRRVALQPGGS